MGSAVNQIGSNTEELMAKFLGMIQTVAQKKASEWAVKIECNAGIFGRKLTKRNIANGRTVHHLL